LKHTLHELDRWQEISHSWLKIRACEVNHRWGRYYRSRDRSKWHTNGSSYNSYLLEKNNKVLFFCWDTTYTDIVKSYAPTHCDLAIMPIGFSDPWIDNHCSPEQALQMAQMLHAKNVVGIHWNSRSWSIRRKESEWEKPLQSFLKSAPLYDINVLWKYEGEVIDLTMPTIKF
jgi:L-ascorbate metabolism protein UlaG (beta-lactamase superfamily)